MNPQFESFEVACVERCFWFGQNTNQTLQIYRSCNNYCTKISFEDCWNKEIISFTWWRQGHHNSKQGERKILIYQAKINNIIS